MLPKYSVGVVSHSFALYTPLRLFSFFSLFFFFSFTLLAFMNCTNDNGRAFFKNVGNTCLSLFTLLTFFLPLVLRFINGTSTWPPSPYTPRFPRCILSSDFEHLSVYPCTSAYVLTCLISRDLFGLFQL